MLAQRNNYFKRVERYPLYLQNFEKIKEREGTPIQVISPEIQNSLNIKFRKKERTDTASYMVGSVLNGMRPIY